MVKTRIVLFLALLAASLLISGTAFAHHSMSMYDRSHDSTFKATITEFNWSNPHSQIIFTAADDHGNIVKWMAECPGPNRLANHGWSKDSLKPGDKITITGAPSKDGQKYMGVGKLIGPDGKALGAEGE